MPDATSPPTPALVLDDGPRRPARSRVWRVLRIGLIVLGAFAFLIGIMATVFLIDAWRAMGTSPSGERLERVEASSHYRDGQFHNDLEPMAPEMWESLKRWLDKSDNTVPDEAPPIVSLTADDFALPPVSGLRITWLGHSTSLIEIDGHRVLFDPVWSDSVSPSSFYGPARFHEPPLPFDELPSIDVVVISHDHYDHLDMETIEALIARDVEFVMPLGVGSHLEYWGVPAARITELDWWDETQIGELRLVATPARHFSGRGIFDKDETLWAGWALIGDAHRVFYSGDTGMHPTFAEIGERLGPFDATLIETGAYNQLWRDVHLGPEQAVAAHQMVRGDLYIPVHWGTFDLALHGWTEPAERAIVAARAAGVRLAIPRAGQQIEPATAPELVAWWPEESWESADESPVIASGLD